MKDIESIEIKTLDELTRTLVVGSIGGYAVIIILLAQDAPQSSGGSGCSCKPYPGSRW